MSLLHSIKSGLYDIQAVWPPFCPHLGTHQVGIYSLIVSLSTSVKHIYLFEHTLPNIIFFLLGIGQSFYLFFLIDMHFFSSSGCFIFLGNGPQINVDIVSFFIFASHSNNRIQLLPS